MASRCVLAALVVWGRLTIDSCSFSVIQCLVCVHTTSLQVEQSVNSLDFLLNGPTVKVLPLSRKLVSTVGRTDYARVSILDGQVEPISISGASVLSSTTRADGFNHSKS